MKKNDISYVVARSKHVKINIQKTREVSKNLKIINNKHLFSDLKNKYDEKKLLSFLLLCESINFCYWPEPRWKIKYKTKTLTGSIAMFMSLKRKLEENSEFFEINNLIKINYEDFCSIFESIDQPICLLKERYKSFMETVKILYKKQEKFYEEILNIKNDLEMLDYIVKTFPSFKDVSVYKFKKIKFYKRATLLVKDYFLLIPKIKNNLRNISNLQSCADYIIPRLLREYGILEYSDKLMHIIDSETELRHNSKMEIEIRANMIYAIKLIKEELKKNKISINEIELDSLLWNYGKKIICKYPHHRTKTIYY